MKRPLTLALGCLALWFAMDTVSSPSHVAPAYAQDGGGGQVPPPPPPPGPANPPVEDGGTDAPTQPEVIEGRDPTDLTRSDSDALEIVKKAAERQGGGAVAEPGGLESFHAVFRKVTLKADGDAVREEVEADRDGVKIAWKHPNKIRTSWTIGGKTTVRAHTGRVGWIHDGTQSSNLLGEQYEKDREQLERDRRMIGALLDVVFLRKMLTDGSVWKIVPDETYAGICVLRLPPKETEERETPQLPIKIWLDTETHDPLMALIQPDGRGASILHYKFEYLSIAPEIRGADGLRFPFHTEVYEQRVAEQEPFMIMDVYIKAVDFNDPLKVTDETFRRPRE